MQLKGKDLEPLHMISYYRYQWAFGFLGVSRTNLVGIDGGGKILTAFGLFGFP